MLYILVILNIFLDARLGEQIWPDAWTIQQWYISLLRRQYMAAIWAGKSDFDFAWVNVS